MKIHNFTEGEDVTDLFRVTVQNEIDGDGDVYLAVHLIGEDEDPFAQGYIRLARVQAHVNAEQMRVLLESPDNIEKFLEA